MSKATVTSVGGLPAEVKRGAIFQAQDGTLYRVTRRRSDSVIEVVLLRWWHRIPWWVWLGLANLLGAVAGQFLWHWWT